MLSIRHFITVCVSLLPIIAQAEQFPAQFVTFDPAPQNPVFVGAGSGHWDVKIRERGWILVDPPAQPGGQPLYRMWYTGYDGTREGIKRLGLATSNDGVQWTRDPRNPLIADLWVEDMMIVRQAGTLFMFAEGRDDIAQLLKSTDGVQWQRLGSLDVRLTNGQPISAGPYGTPVGYFENDKWFLFYERRDAGVWLATSTDMQVWRNVQDDPVLVPGPAAHEQDLMALNQLVKHDGRYYAFYHGSQKGSGLWSSNIAVSDDLRHWTKYERNPLFPLVDNKSSPQLVPDGQRYRLYTLHDQVRLHFSR